MHSIRQALNQVSSALGFSALGVADAMSPQGAGLQDWLASGAHADMAWMERHLEARLNPDLVLPEVKRVIMLSYEYSRHDQREAAGRIARYAQGADYHKLLAPKLADLDELLQSYGGVQRCFTDSGPVSERFFAEQAGLGWRGRHGLIISKDRGSYCVLASILTTLELPIDRPHANFCGSCHRCEQACPTGALKDGYCDARRCLSYWTIEAKQPTPTELANTAPERIYGCDICQEACPWNHRASKHPQHIDPHLLLPHWLKGMSPDELLAMSESEFQKRFQHSPMRRAGLARIQRALRSFQQG
ncbi:MAG: tRNA epoxyqueuosine(34) reductase QueG [Akkermansia sp.]